MARPKKHNNEVVLEPQFTSWLDERGYNWVQDDCIDHDFIIAGKTAEVKFRGSDYPDVLVELFNCADPIGCKDCQRAGNTQPLLGWGHRESYSKADLLVYVHMNNDDEMSRIVVLYKKDFIKWLWDVHLASSYRHKMITAFYGMHRTLCVAVPIHLIPEELYKEYVI